MYMYAYFSLGELSSAVQYPNSASVDGSGQTQSKVGMLCMRHAMILGYSGLYQE